MPLSQNLHMMLSHNEAMRKEWSTRASIVAIVTSLFALSPISAYADSTPTPDASRSAFEQYRIDRENYLAAVKQRSAAIRNINIAFKSACDKAAYDFKSAMAVARTPDQKNAAVTARKNAISAAIVIRDDSIAALGAEPVPPVEPMKPFKVSSKNKSR
jgi:hypothetical protein